VQARFDFVWEYVCSLVKLLHTAFAVFCMILVNTPTAREWNVFFAHECLILVPNKSAENMEQGSSIYITRDQSMHSVLQEVIRHVEALGAAPLEVLVEGAVAVDECGVVHEGYTAGRGMGEKFTCRTPTSDDIV
jgi:preprotein translocase subunit SecY